MLYNQDWEKKSSPVADLLYRAADIIEQRGHVKETFIGRDGRVCAVGALLKADDRQINGLVVMTPLAEVAANKVVASLTAAELGSHNEFHLNPLCGWNNRPETTGEIVVAKFREVAALVNAE